jgi:hypothetical protein
MARKTEEQHELPPQVKIARDLPPGRYPLLAVFPGLNKATAFRKYPCTAAERKRLAEKSSVEIVKRKGEWMYVAPHEVPPDADARWKPITSPDDCIVVSREHLQKSPALVLYMDILHELYHVVQRRAGRELWDEKYSYVDRPTEVEAYQFAVEEARKLRASEPFLRDYLRVAWVSHKEHRRLLKNVGVKSD